jgi:hypothetical protein
MFLKTGTLGALLLAISPCQVLAGSSLIEKGRLITEANCQRCHSSVRRPC